MDICQIGYDICEFDSLRGLGIDVIGRVHFDNRDRFAIWMGSIGDRTMSTNEWLLTSDFWQFLEPWHGRWCEYEIFIASCTDNIYDLENERWLLGTWLIMLGFMDLGWPRVYRRSTSVLFRLFSSLVVVRPHREPGMKELFLLHFNRPHSQILQFALVPYPTTHHSEQKCAHFCSEWCIVGYVTSALWDLWISSVYRHKLLGPWEMQL